MSGELEALGVDGLLLFTHTTTNVHKKGLFNLYNIADSVIFQYIILGCRRTGVNISPSTGFELAKHSNIVGIKEASGNISRR